MVKIDLITGFLGSGKTTFLKKYARYHLAQKENICILENDFGAVNVDMMLLHDLMEEGCDMEMVAGGCDKDCHIRRFKTKLIAMGMCGYDRVIVEPSGIFDVDEFFDILREEPLDRWYQIDNVIAIVDGGLENELSPASEYLLASQAANAGSILFSKVGDNPGREEEVTAHLDRALAEIKYKGQDPAYKIWKDWNALSEEDFRRISSGGYHMASYEKLHFKEEEQFDSVYFMKLELKKEELFGKIEQLLQSDEYGNIFRIKGFFQEEDDSWNEINVTKEQFKVDSISQGQDVIIVIGENLKKEKLESYFMVKN